MSTDRYEKATTIVTTIMKPYNAHNDRLSSYQKFEYSSSARCTPSNGIELRSDWGTFVYDFEILNVRLALERGWRVVTPD